MEEHASEKHEVYLSPVKLENVGKSADEAFFAEREQEIKAIEERLQRDVWAEAQPRFNEKSEDKSISKVDEDSDEKF